VKAVFADTFYWVALTNPGDSRYQDAVALDPVLADRVVFTTDEILTEFMTFFSADPWQRSRAAATVRSLLANPEVRVIPQSRGIVSCGNEPLRGTSGQRLQFDGLHLHANDAKRRDH
jgi:hypothetical protein